MSYPLAAKKFQIRTAVLVVINVALVTAIVALCAAGTQIDLIINAAPAKITQQQSDFQIPVLTVNADSIQTQALFHESRQFYIPPDPMQVAVPLSPPDYHFVGAMTLPKQSALAFLVHNQTGARQKVKKGDTLDGWLVDSVDGKHVMLSMNGTQTQISAGTAGDTQMRSSGLQPVSNLQRSMSSSNLNVGGQSTGLRVVSGEQMRSHVNTQQPRLPAGPPGGVGARLYRPPPEQ